MAAMGGEQHEIAFAEFPVLSLALDAESRPLDERFHHLPGARRRRQIPSKVPGLYQCGRFASGLA